MKNISLKIFLKNMSTNLSSYIVYKIWVMVSLSLDKWDFIKSSDLCMKCVTQWSMQKIIMSILFYFTLKHGTPWITFHSRSLNLQNILCSFVIRKFWYRTKKSKVSIFSLYQSSVSINLSINLQSHLKRWHISFHVTHVKNQRTS